jgi:parallel beta-helix repeat protein
MYSTNDLQKLVQMLAYLGIVDLPSAPHSVLIGGSAGAAPGAAGTVLISNGASADPSFQALTDISVAPLAAINSSKLSFLQAGTGAAARTVQSRLRDTISVYDFGAKGDGVTDDTAAIQNALNAAGSNNTVLLPPGSFAVTGIAVPSGVTLMGCGAGSILVPAAGFSSGGNLVVIASNAVNSSVQNFAVNLPTTYGSSTAVLINTGASFCSVRDVYMTSGGAFGVDLVQAINCEVERVTILAAATIGIESQNGSWNRIIDCYVTGVVGSHHFQITNEVNSEIRGCRSYLLTGSGFGMNLNGCSACRITNCFAQDSVAEGINITNSSNCVVTGSTVRWTGSQSQDFGISIEASTGGSSSLNIISNNVVLRSGKSGIAIAGSQTSNAANIVTGNSIFSAGMLGLPNDGGILIYQNTGTATQNVVENNVIYGDGVHTRYGVLESNAYGSAPNGNRIALNGVFNVTVANVSTVGAATVSFIPAGW